jgi:hypothetical protein
MTSFLRSKGFRYVGVPLLFLLIVSLTTFVAVQILKNTQYMGLRLESLYEDLFQGKPNVNSQMDVSIRTKDCTLEATYSGTTYQKIQAVSGDESCKRFNYENGDSPSPINEELVNRDLENSYNRQKRLTR